jgi:hypothetical protein
MEEWHRPATPEMHGPLLEANLGGFLNALEHGGLRGCGARGENGQCPKRARDGQNWQEMGLSEDFGVNEPMLYFARFPLFVVFWAWVARSITALKSPSLTGLER